MHRIPLPLQAARRIAKQQKASLAVVHAMMSLAQLVFLTWRGMVAEAQAERRMFEKGLRLWVGGAVARGWLTWVAYVDQAQVSAVRTPFLPPVTHPSEAL